MPRNANFWSLLEPKLRAAGGKVAIETTSGHSITHTALADRVGRAGAGLLSLGLKPGDRVVAQIPKSIDGVVLYLATLKIGAVFAPVCPWFSAEHLLQCLGDAVPTLLVASGPQLARVSAGLGASRVRASLSLEADGSGSFAGMLARQQPVRASAVREETDPALLLYIRAPDGHVCGAIHTHRSLADNAAALQAAWPISAGDTILHALSTWHAQGSMSLLHVALLGAARTVAADGLASAMLCGALRRAHIWFGEAHDYAALLALPAFDTSEAAQLRLAAAPALHLDDALRRQFEDRSGVALASILSLRETGVIRVEAARTGRFGGPGSPGCSVRIRDGDGPHGVLEVTGSGVFSGYWRNAKATGAAFTEDGFFRTRVRATRNPDGSFVVLGMTDDRDRPDSGKARLQP